MKFSDRLRQSEVVRSEMVRAFTEEAVEAVERGQLSDLLVLILETWQSSGEGGVLDRGNLLRIHDRLVVVLAPAGQVQDSVADDILLVCRTALSHKHLELSQVVLPLGVPTDLLEVVGRWAAALNQASTEDGLRRLALLLELHDLFFGPEDISYLREQALEAEKAQQCRKNTLLGTAQLPSEAWARALLVLFRTHRELRRSGVKTVFSEQLAQKLDQPMPLIRNLVLHWAATLPVIESLLELDGDMEVFRPSIPKLVEPLASPHGLTHYLMVAGPPKVGKSSLTFSLEDSGLVDVFPISPGHDTPDQLSPLKFDKKNGKINQRVVNQERERWKSGEGETVMPVVMARGCGDVAADGTALNLFIEDVPGGLFTRQDESHSWRHWIANRKPTAVALLIPAVGDFDSTPYQRVVDEILKHHEGLPVFLLVNRFDEQLASYSSKDVDPELLAAVARLGERPVELGVDAGALTVADPKATADSLGGLALVTRQLQVLNQTLPIVGKHPASLHFICCRHASPELRRSSVKPFWEEAFDQIDGATRASRADWFERHLIKPIEDNYASGTKTQTAAIAAACARCNRVLRSLVEEGWDEGEKAIASRNAGIELINHLAARLDETARDRCSSAAKALTELRQRLDELLDRLFVLVGIPSRLSSGDYPNSTQRTFIDQWLGAADSQVVKPSGSSAVYSYLFGTLSTGIPIVDDPGSTRPEWRSYEELRAQLVGAQSAEAFFKRRMGVQALTAPAALGSWLGLEPLKTDLPRFIASAGSDRSRIAEILGQLCEPLIALSKSISENLDFVERYQDTARRRLADGIAGAWEVGSRSDVEEAVTRFNAVKGRFQIGKTWRQERSAATVAIRTAVGVLEPDSLIDDSANRGYLKAVLEAARAVAPRPESVAGGDVPEPELPLVCEAEAETLKQVPRQLAVLREHHLHWLKRFVEATGWVEDRAANQPLLPPDPNVPPDNQPVDAAFVKAARGIVEQLRAGDD